LEDDNEEKGRGRWRRGFLVGLIRRSAMAAAAAGFTAPVLVAGRGVGFWGRERGRRTSAVVER
jgi:hypothetical protein